MSRYADKHPHTAECANRGCEGAGEVLRMYDGKPFWWCQGCADQLDEKAAG